MHQLHPLKHQTKQQTWRKTLKRSQRLASIPLLDADMDVVLLGAISLLEIVVVRVKRIRCMSPTPSSVGQSGSKRAKPIRDYTKKNIKRSKRQQAIDSG